MFAQGWMVPVLGSAVILAVVAAVLVVRAWPRNTDMSPTDRAEIAATPMPSLQKRATWGFAIGVVAFAVISWLLTTRGAMEYWDNDSLRLTVLGIFMVGLLGCVGVTTLPLIQPEIRKRLDERDQAVLARAPRAQPVLMILGLAAWLIPLTQKFHDEGAVPVVYLYLIFGSMILLMVIGEALGILLGYWFGARHGQS